MAVFRYYFDIDDGKGLNIDGVGLDLPDFEAARQEALRALPEIAGMLSPADDQQTYRVRIRDRSGHPVLLVKLELMAQRL